MDSPFKGKKVAQVAIVVKDIDAAKARWSAMLGQPVAFEVLTEPGEEVRMTFRGAPTNAQCKLAFFELPNLQIELIQPLGGESVWQWHLDEHGESVQHIAFWVDDMKVATDFLAAQDIPLEQRGDMGEGQYGYYNGREMLGVTLELLENQRTELG